MKRGQIEQSEAQTVESIRPASPFLLERIANPQTANLRTNLVAASANQFSPSEFMKNLYNGGLYASLFSSNCQRF
jgi:hypothetical protein